MDHDAHIRILTTVPELESIRAQWEALGGNRDSQIDCYLSCLQSRPEILRPHILALYRGDTPDAILVGRLERGHLDFKVGYMHVRPKATVLYFVYGALRGNASYENSRLFVNEICRYLDRNEADAAYLNFLPTDSHLYRLAKTIPGLPMRDKVCDPQPHYVASIPRTVKSFYQGLSPNTRWQVRNKQKRLAGDLSDAVRVRCFREPAEIDELIQDVEQVASKSYQRALGVGFVSNAEIRRRLCLKAEQGWLRAYVLYTADRPGAFWIGDVNDGIFGSDYLGYDDALGKYSPGIYLMTKVIEGFCEDSVQGVKKVDFATGEAQYKRMLANHEWQEAALYIFAPSLRGAYLNLLRYLTGGVNRLVKSQLGHSTVFQKARKYWRQAAKHRAVAKKQVAY